MRIAKCREVNLDPGVPLVTPRPCPFSLMFPGVTLSLKKFPGAGHIKRNIHAKSRRLLNAIFVFELEGHFLFFNICCNSFDRGKKSSYRKRELLCYVFVNYTVFLRVCHDIAWRMIMKWSTFYAPSCTVITAIVILCSLLTPPLEVALKPPRVQTHHVVHPRKRVLWVWPIQA